MITLEDQGFYGPSRAIMQGIMGYRQKQQQDRENKWRDDEFSLQRRKLDLDTEQNRQRIALDQSRFDEEKLNNQLGRRLTERKLRQPEQFDPAKHVKTLSDGTQVLVDPETGSPTKVIEADPYKDMVRNSIRNAVSRPDQSVPVGTNSVLKPSATDSSNPSILQSPIPGTRVKTWGPGGMTLEPIVNIEPPNIIERDAPGGGKQQFIEFTDPNTGEKKYEVYHGAREKQIGDEALNKLNITSLALSQIPDIEKAVNDAGDAGGPVAGRIANLVDAVGGTPNEHQRAFGSLNARMLVPVAKGILGETGALSKDDIANYAPLLPNYLDTQQSRREKVAKLRSLITTQRDNVLQNLKRSGRDIGALESSPSLQIPPEPDLVIMTNPDGKQVKVPRADVEKALKNGYTQ